jgi:hypothetical protein
MTMNQTLQSLRSSLPRYAGELARSAARRPALAPYATPDALLAALEALHPSGGRAGASSASWPRR